MLGFAPMHNILCLREDGGCVSERGILSEERTSEQYSTINRRVGAIGTQQHEGKLMDYGLGGHLSILPINLRIYYLSAPYNNIVSPSLPRNSIMPLDLPLHFAPPHQIYCRMAHPLNPPTPQYKIASICATKQTQNMIYWPSPYPSISPYLHVSISLSLLLPT